MLLKKHLAAVAAVATLAAGFMMASPLAAHAAPTNFAPITLHIARNSSVDILANIVKNACANGGFDFTTDNCGTQWNPAYDFGAQVDANGTINGAATTNDTTSLLVVPTPGFYDPTTPITVDYIIDNADVTGFGPFTGQVEIYVDSINDIMCGDAYSPTMEDISAYLQGADPTSGTQALFPTFGVPTNVNWTLTLKPIIKSGKDNTVGTIDTTTIGRAKTLGAIYTPPANFTGPDKFDYTLTYVPKGSPKNTPATPCLSGRVDVNVVDSFAATLATDINTPLSISANDLFAANTGYFPLPTKGNANISVVCYPIQASKGVVKTLGSLSPVRTKAIKGDALLTYTPPKDFTGVDHFACDVTVGKVTVEDAEIIVNVGPVTPEPTPEPTPAPAPAPKPDNGGGAAGPGAPTGGSVQSGGIAGLAGVVMLAGLAAGTVVLRRRAVATH